MGLQLQPIDEEEGRASPSISERQYWRTFDSCVHLLAVALAASVATLLLTRLCGQQTSWLPVVAVFREQAPAHCQLQAVNVPPPPVPPVLEHLAIYVAFHWDISHLTALSRVRTRVFCRVFRAVKSPFVVRSGLSCDCRGAIACARMGCPVTIFPSICHGATCSEACPPFTSHDIRTLTQLMSHLFIIVDVARAAS